MKPIRLVQNRALYLLSSQSPGYLNNFDDGFLMDTGPGGQTALDRAITAHQAADTPESQANVEDIKKTLQSAGAARAQELLHNFSRMMFHLLVLITRMLFSAEALIRITASRFPCGVAGSCAFGS